MLWTLLSASLLTLAATVAVPAQDLPTTNYEGAPLGADAPFEGNWAMGRPGRMRDSLVSCVSPTTLRVTEAGDLGMARYARSENVFPMSVDDGRTSLSEGSYIYEVVWATGDRFFLYPINRDGSFDTVEVMQYNRCPDWPQQSSLEAPDGDAEPLTGNWTVEVPPRTAEGPNEVAVSCDDPIILKAAGADTLTIDAGQGPVEVSIHAANGRTVWQEPEIPPAQLVWQEPDRFLMYFNGFDGTIDWDSPMIYERC